MTTQNLGNVLVRSDLNVPINNGSILDNFRIIKSIEYIDKLEKISRSITFISHLGRPNGIDSSLSLKPVADEMSKLLGRDVTFMKNKNDKKIETLLYKNKKSILLLENLRFNEGEVSNDNKFAKDLARPFDTYILDAFGASHRNHASIVSVGSHLNSYQGPLMSKEIDELDKVLRKSQRISNFKSSGSNLKSNDLIFLNIVKL